MNEKLCENCIVGKECPCQDKAIKTWEMLKEFTESSNPERLKAFIINKEIREDELYPYDYISLLDGVFYWNGDFKKPFRINDFYNPLQIMWCMK